MPEPKPNLELLRRVLRQIDEHPETWEQSDYATKTQCGTRYCVAGHAVAMNGIEMQWRQGDYPDQEYAMRTTSQVEIFCEAQERIGLTDYEADKLFNASNSRADLERIATQIADRAGEPLWPEEATPCA